MDVLQAMILSEKHMVSLISFYRKYFCEKTADFKFSVLEDKVENGSERLMMRPFDLNANNEKDVYKKDEVHNTL